MKRCNSSYAMARKRSRRGRRSSASLLAVSHLVGQQTCDVARALAFIGFLLHGP